MANNQNQQAPVVEPKTKVEAFVLKYKKAICGAVAAVIVVVAGGILLNNFYFTPRQAEASTALAKGQDLFAQQQYDKALNGDGAGYIGFLKVIDQYSGTDAANLAKLYAGLSYANLGKFKEAEAQLDGYSASDDAVVSPAAEAALGNVQASLNKLDDAVSSLKKAAKMADSKAASGHNLSISPIFLLQAAQILENQGKTEDALAIYKSIKSDYVGSAVSRDIDKYIERCTK